MRTLLLLAIISSGCSAGLLKHRPHAYQVPNAILIYNQKPIDSFWVVDTNLTTGECKELYLEDGFRVQAIIYPLSTEAGHHMVHMKESSRGRYWLVGNYFVY